MPLEWERGTTGTPMKYNSPRKFKRTNYSMRDGSWATFSRARSVPVDVMNMTEMKSTSPESLGAVRR